MASVASGLMKLFKKDSAAGTSVGTGAGRPSRRSSGLGEFTKRIAGQEGLTILDLGPTSPQNISHITSLGHKVYNEDVLLASLDPSFTNKKDEAASAGNVERFLAENLSYSKQQFDAVLCWDIPDYMDESLVRAFIERLGEVLKPGGVLLAFFHTKDAGPEAPYFRYHIAGADTLELQRGPQFRLQRVFNNRHVENLFKEWGNIKFFLARDNVREVLVVR